MNKTDKRVVIGVVIVFLSAFLLMIMGKSMEVDSFTAVVTQLKKTEREGGATADGIIGGGTYYYAYVECADKTMVKFEITEHLFNTCSTGITVEIKAKQTLGEKLFNSAKEKSNPQNYQYFIGDTEIIYHYRMIDDKIID